MTKNSDLATIGVGSGYAQGQAGRNKELSALRSYMTPNQRKRLDKYDARLKQARLDGNRADAAQALIDAASVYNELACTANIPTAIGIRATEFGIILNADSGKVLSSSIDIPDGLRDSLRFRTPGLGGRTNDGLDRTDATGADKTQVSVISKDNSNTGINATENNLQAQSEQIYSKTLAMAPKDLTLTDDQRVAKALIAAKFDLSTVAAVIENGSPRAKIMDESVKSDYSQGVAKTAEANIESDTNKLTSAFKSADRGIEA
jgi:hypothetical protein